MSNTAANYTAESHTLSHQQQTLLAAFQDAAFVNGGHGIALDEDTLEPMPAGKGERKFRGFNLFSTCKDVELTFFCDGSRLFVEAPEVENIAGDDEPANYVHTGREVRVLVTAHRDGGFVVKTEWWEVTHSASYVHNG